jgi:hypothetical protein
LIEHLRSVRAANFYKRKKALSDYAVRKLFTTVRQDTREPSNNLFREIRVESGDVVYSSLCFSFERRPSFLEAEADVWERIFGFLLIVESDELIAVFKSALDLSSEFKSNFLQKLSISSLESAIAPEAAVFEKLRLRNMSTSNLALRSKTLEARDLKNTVAVSSASRFIPQAYTVRRSDGSYSATPNTGRISTQAEKANLNQLISWSRTVMDSLRTGSGQTSAFIRNFARPIALSDIPAAVHPTYLSFDTGSLKETFYGEESQVRLVRKQGETFEPLTVDEGQAVLTDLDRNFIIEERDGDYPILNPEDELPKGKVSIGKTRISLPGFTRTAIADLHVENASDDNADETKRKPLARFLDSEDRFILLFTDLTLAYIDGSLFRDDALLAGGATFMAHLQAVPALAHTTSEKGRFARNQTEFEAGSVFRVVVDDIAADADLLICDDLGDEWADFIAIGTESDPPTVSFYHAKHGEQSLSASAFHESVGQAIKNLGRMTLPQGAMPPKYTAWDRTYAGPRVRTSISRIVRGGTREAVETRIDSVRVAPDLLRRAFIVTSSLSRTAVARVFDEACAGIAPSPHFVQLYWLLMSYFSACTEVGVTGYVICRP